MDIYSFQGEYRWLSNFWPCDILFDDRVYPSVENAYQAAKVDEIYRYKISQMKPGEAKRFTRTVPTVLEWNDEYKLRIMNAFLFQKFRGELAVKLIATDGLIIEGNTWGDTFWGMCKGKGENHLGRLIMKIRQELRERSEVGNASN